MVKGYNCIKYRQSLKDRPTQAQPEPNGAGRNAALAERGFVYCQLAISKLKYINLQITLIKYTILTQANIQQINYIPF